MKKVLVITYSFPPSNAVSIHRVLRLGRWLPKYGWEPIILTCKNRIFQRNDTKNIFFVKKYFSYVTEADNLFCKIISKIAKTKNFYLKNAFKVFFWSLFIPDRFAYWFLPGIREGKALIKKHNIDLIWATIPSPTSGLIGAYLSRKTKTPLIVDYRDPWTLSNLNRKFIIKQQINKVLEKLMLGQANAICTTSKPMSQLFADKKYFTIDKIHTITNSVDLKLQHIKNKKNPPSEIEVNKINITHVGSFYKDRQPFSFIKALDILIQKQPEFRNLIKVNFVGNPNYNRIINYCKERNILNLFSFIGLLSFNDAINYMINSKVLLVFNGESDYNKIYVPGKLYDYLSVKKPILFIGKGQPAEIIDELKIGESAMHNPECIYRVLSKMITNLDSYKVNDKAFVKYSSENISRSLSDLFNKVVLNQKTI